MELAKRVLVIAGEFPPYKTIGRIRSVKLCQHLPASGWVASVLTISMNQSFGADLSTLDEIPDGVPVYRASLPEPSKRITRILKNLPIGRYAAHNSGSGNLTSIDASPQSSTLNWIKIAKSRVDHFINRNLMIPDDWLLWVIPAVREAKKFLRSNRVDMILTTAPPFSSLLIGRWLKSATGIPWIADYRDLWTGDVLRDWVPRWRRRFEILLEKWALSSANAIVTVSEPKTAFISKRLSKLPQSRFFTVTNGYDIEEYENLTKQPQSSNALRMVYTGRLFKNRRGYELLHAVGKLFEANPALKPKLQIEYYGGVALDIQETMASIITQYGLQSNVSFLPDISYEKAKQLQMDADILLLIVDTGETTSGVIPGKLFEYVAAKTPILCIAESGATSEIIENGGIGWVVKPGDVESLQQLIGHILSTPTALRTPRNDEYLSQYDRRRLVARMAGIMTKIVSNNA